MVAHRIWVILAALSLGLAGWSEPEPTKSEPEPNPEPKQESAAQPEPEAERTTEEESKPETRSQPRPAGVRPPVSPGQVVGASARVSSAACCSNCQGKGQAIEKRPGSVQEVVPGIRTRVDKDQLVRCGRCNGSGLSTSSLLVNTMKDFGRQLARLNDADERWPAASERVLKNFRDIAKYGAAAWASLNNNKLQTMISQNVDPKGEAIFFVGRLNSDRVEAAPEGGMAVRTMHVSLTGGGRAGASGEVIFERPLVVDASDADDVVLCGGVIARRAADGGRFVIYIDRGYVVRFDGPADDLDGDR